MNVGIDKIGLYVPHHYLDMTSMAIHRHVDANKYKIGIGQEKTAVIAPHEDIVTMAIEAAYDIVQDDLTTIDTILFATESGIDFSKSAGNYVHRMLKLHPNVRILELKQACYAMTGALHLACEMVRANPTKKALVLASDVAWYGFHTAGEATQGAGAVALLVSANPRIAVVHPGVVTTEDLADFYRPSYKETPEVDGKLSVRCYTQMLQKVDPGMNLPYTCFHLPFAAMADKANASLRHPMTQTNVERIKHFGKAVGNIYNGSLYLSLLSVLTQDPSDLSHQTIGMFSYGSGAIAEFFDLTIQPGYQNALERERIVKQLAQRVEIDFSTYEQWMSVYALKERSEAYAPDPSFQTQATRFALERIERGHRHYLAVTPSSV
jgi:hydroxymethylglutaryl-CoA synthase